MPSAHARIRAPLAQDGRQVHTSRAESALDGYSGFDHAVIMSVSGTILRAMRHAPPATRLLASLPPPLLDAAGNSFVRVVKLNIGMSILAAENSGSDAGCHSCGCEEGCHSQNEMFWLYSYLLTAECGLCILVMAA